MSNLKEGPFERSGKASKYYRVFLCGFLIQTEEIVTVMLVYVKFERRTIRKIWEGK